MSTLHSWKLLVSHQCQSAIHHQKDQRTSLISALKEETCCRFTRTLKIWAQLIPGGETLLSLKLKVLIYIHYQISFLISYNPLPGENGPIGMTIQTPEWRYTEYIEVNKRNKSKRIYYWDREPVARELYNLKTDFFENTNVIEEEENKEIIKDLRHKLRSMMRRE